MSTRAFLVCSSEWRTRLLKGSMGSGVVTTEGAAATAYPAMKVKAKMPHKSMDVVHHIGANTKGMASMFSTSPSCND